jgi:hypothetical protein
MNLFSQIHQILFHGKGGYDYNTIYNMPIWLRKFTYSEIKSFYDEEKKLHESSSSGDKGTKNLITKDGKVNTPAFSEASKSYKGQTSYK